ncbi:O-antigen ligase family protein [Mucilaginibacter arboris]|uniref:O-antigen ligase domain-containing protein n=1 Tax=Mucilaginibacter arboris TaxID=2682090 RepID=A0A7K1T1Q2_9SPHI|nr:O-antigen ligase family protein [Mucilaginibacter arboris]MVN23447.1 O-antigen ligase domain-containing protein [Mucilaginibacter arboris]
MNTIIKIFNYRFTVKEFLILFFGYLFMEQIFSWLFAPTSEIIQPYQKIFGFVIYGYMLYNINELKFNERIFIGIFTLLLLRLVLESLYVYNTFFQQLTMYYVLFPAIYSIFIKNLCRTYDFDLLEFMAKFYLYTYIVFMAIYGRGFSFSLEGLDLEDLGVFSGDGRIIHATSIFMMILPFLWYLNKFIKTKKGIDFIPLAFCFIVILIHQHRSVWGSCIAAIVIYLGISMHVNKERVPRIWGLIVGGIVLLVLAYFFVSTLFPELTTFLGQRFSDILDLNKQESTGRFRVEQREVYGRLFWERPVFGWTFEGFEMPNPLVDWWPEKTGQHFHEGFMEVLFYHGIVGLLFKYGFIFYLAVRAFSKKLSESTVVLIAFCLSGILFSLSYVPQTVFWGHVGLCLYYLEKDDLKSEEDDDLIEDDEFYIEDEPKLPKQIFKGRKTVPQLNNAN